MKTGFGLLLTLAVFALTANQAEAQRGRGTYTTPYGQFNSGDLAATGGNPFAAEAFHEQKLMMQQQQMMARQQQQYMQQMAQREKTYKEYLKNNPNAAKSATKPPVATKKKAAAKAKAKTETPAPVTTPKPTTTTVPGAPPSTKAK